jgi:hypothetical protein
MNTEQRPPMIFGKISDCIAEVEAVGKNHKNLQQGYLFRSIDDFYDALQPVFAKHRIFVTPTILEHAREERQTKSGGTIMTTLAKVRFKIFAEDGSYIEADALGEGSDSGDKSANKAAAMAMKYLFMQVFAVRVNGERLDTEHDSPSYLTKPATAPKPATAARAATEATRKWAWEQLTARCGPEAAWNYLVAKGWITAEQTDLEWPLDKVPTTRADLDAIYREIEVDLQSNTPSKQADGLPDDLRAEIIVVPRAGMKRTEYMVQPDTIGSLYDAMKAGDEAAQKRLFGMAHGWQPQPWVNNQGHKMPPNDADLRCRAALDRFLDIIEARK